MRQKLPSLTEKRGENYGREGKRDGENEKSVGRAKMATQHALLSKDPKNVILFILRLLCVLAARLQRM